jgi:hypothetical protein
MRAMKRVTVPADFDFYNRNTIQVWDVSSVASVEVRKWKGVTLEDRSLHEITIVNNNNTKAIKFSSIYSCRIQIRLTGSTFRSSRICALLLHSITGGE